MDENVTVRIEADTQPFEAALNDLQQLSQDFGRQLTGALQGAVVNGRSLEDVLRRLALNLAGMALGQGLKPLQGLFSSLFGQMLGGITPFAKGGVVASPTYFGSGGGLGLMGEAGAEAILPLARGADGRLGVAAGGQGRPVNIVFNVTSPDAASFRKSEAQVTGMLARAVSRGTRSL
ncbi:MAG: phage tail tape measure protein [Rhizobiaceae bacterium]